MTLKRKLFLSLSIFMTSLLLVACQSEPNETSDPIELTIEELAFYDGKNGKKAYIAVDGIIYDVTNSDAWNQGLHNGFQAGRDLSVEIMSSPHGKAFLSRVPEVGILVETPKPDMLTAISSVSGYESLVSLIYSGQVDIDFDSFEAVTLFLPSLDALALNSMFEIPDNFDPENGFDDLLNDFDIFNFLRYHMVDQTLLLETLRLGESEIETLSGEMITVSVVNNEVLINGVSIQTSDILATNGVIHVLEGVLVPPSLQNTIQVRFIGLEGKLIKEESYTIGDILIFPYPPEEGGYTFVGFDTNSITLTESIIVTLQYEKIYMTLDELSVFDGKDGEKAYIALGGIIYDVTGNPYWPNGLHQGLFQAGQDLTSVLSQSPHGIQNVLDQPVVAFLKP